MPEASALVEVHCGILGSMHPDYVATPRETVAELLKTAGRNGPDAAAPVRRLFVQRGSQSAPEAGLLAAFVRNGDQRGLDLFLLLKATASSPPFDSHRSAAVWARALLHSSPSASPQTVSKIWKRLEGLKLVRRGRHGRLANVTLLCEDGSGRPYVHPADDNEAYLQVPVAYWLSDENWCSTLSLPAKAVMLIGLSLPPGFVLPVERVPEWYGISADSAQRGISELEKRSVLQRHRTKRKAPLAPLGFTTDSHYTLVGDLAKPKRSAHG